MKSKVAMFIYVAFALVSFLFGVKMFQMGDTLRGVLFMVGLCFLYISIDFTNNM